MFRSLLAKMDHSQTTNLRLLFVGMHESPHLHRWVRMVARPDTTILVFPVMHGRISLPSDFTYVRLDHVSATMLRGIYVVEPDDAHSPDDAITNKAWGYEPWSHSFFDPAELTSPERLRSCIEQFKPDILHTMETQMAGYLCAEAAKRSPDRFPPWIQSTWGSDIFLFRKLPGHYERLNDVFRRVQLHLSDCARDRMLAREVGYTGPDLPVIPASGGVDFDQLTPTFTRVPPSKRKMILLKGHHNFAQRGLIALSALVLAQEQLIGYKIGILNAGPHALRWVERLRSVTRLDVDATTYLERHGDVLSRLAEARCIVGLGISDGVPITMLEAMLVGTLPIQSSTSACDEWVEHGQTGIIVSPHDTREIADAIIRAATDDALVDTAAARNFQTLRRNWSLRENRKVAWQVYSGLLGREKLPHQAELI
jgi:hypothetical protein